MGTGRTAGDKVEIGKTGMGCFFGVVGVAGDGELYGPHLGRAK